MKQQQEQQRLGANGRSPSPNPQAWVASRGVEAPRSSEAGAEEADAKQRRHRKARETAGGGEGVGGGGGDGPPPPPRRKKVAKNTDKEKEASALLLQEVHRRPAPRAHLAHRAGCTQSGCAADAAHEHSAHSGMGREEG